MVSIFSDWYSSLKDLATDGIRDIIVRDESTNRYARITTADLETLDIPNEYHLHEIIPPQRIQRLRFDIDGKEESVQGLITAVIEEVKKLYKSFSADDLPDCMITTASKPGKQSYHILTPLYCENNRVAGKFAQMIHEKLRDHPQYQYLDLQVHKAFQSFRLLGCSKAGEKRPKMPLGEGGIFEHLVGWYSDEKPLMIYGECEDYVLEIEDGDASEYFKKLPDADCWEFRNRVGNIFNYNRLKPSHCQVCNKIHENDHTMYILLSHGVWLCCRHNKKKIVMEKASGQLTLGELTPEQSTLGELTPEQSILGNPSIDLTPYLDAKTLLIKAPMKMGKTKAVSNVLTGRVLFISFRQTFSHSLQENLKDFASYMDIEGTLSLDEHPRLIVQVDSLLRLDSSIPDILVLDESESILNQFSSNLIRSPEWVFAKFLRIVKQTPRVICMDAHLSARTERLMTKWRGEVTKYYNPYRNATADKYYWLDKTEELIQLAIDKLQSGKKIVICSNSLEEARIIEHHIMKQVKLARLTDDPTNGPFIASYTSETSPSLKKLHFSDVNRWWKCLDVLIYTPTVTAGISFEETHFDCILGYFTSLSCDVETAIQMLGRVRSVRDKEYFICVKQIPSFLPYEVDKLRRISTSCFVASNSDRAPVNPIFDDAGNLIYESTPFFDLWLENLAFKNYSKNFYFTHFRHLIALTGATFHEVIQKPAEIVRSTARIEQSKLIAAAQDITDEQYEAYEKAIQTNAPVEISTGDMHSLKKKGLQRLYQEPITPEFVFYFDRPEVKSAYRNLREVYDCIKGPQSYTAVLDVIKSRELIRREKYITNFKSDITVEFVYLRHYFALQILFNLGFDKLSTAVLNSDFEARLKIAGGFFDHKQAEFVFGISGDASLAFYRQILRKQYRISILHKDKKWRAKLDPELDRILKKA